MHGSYNVKQTTKFHKHDGPIARTFPQKSIAKFTTICTKPDDTESTGVRTESKCLNNPTVPRHKIIVSRAINGKLNTQKGFN